METSGILTLFWTLTKQSYTLSFPDLDSKLMNPGSPSPCILPDPRLSIKIQITLIFQLRIYHKSVWEWFLQHCGQELILEKVSVLLYNPSCYWTSSQTILANELGRSLLQHSQTITGSRHHCTDLTINCDVPSTLLSKCCWMLVTFLKLRIVLEVKFILATN